MGSSFAGANEARAAVPARVACACRLFAVAARKNDLSIDFYIFHWPTVVSDDALCRAVTSPDHSTAVGFINSRRDS